MLCLITVRPNLKLVCKELGTVKHKYFDIGVQLGVPIHELKLFEKENSPLSSVVGYWLGANAVDVPVTWGSVVEALNDVGEIGLANTISKKYCKGQKLCYNYRPSCNMGTCQDFRY